uniref:DUF4397 domain-containing protein n=1 Tax=Schlesneria paludicola TaxID=360056 RepID=A0A7C4QHU3_9PLAN
MLHPRVLPAVMTLALVGAGCLPAWAQLSRTAELYVIHGLPGDELDDPSESIDFPNNLPVDILIGLNGTGTLNLYYTNVHLGEVRGPLALTTGTYTLQVRQANLTTPGTGTIYVSGTLAVRSGESHSSLIHITTTGLPRVTDYLNDNARVGLTSARVTFRHGSRNGPVDMSLVSTLGLPGVAVNNLSNPQQSAAITTSTGPYTLSVKPAGQATTLLPPSAVFLAPKNAYFFYLVGSTTRGTLRVITHNYPPLSVTLPPIP